MLTLCDMHTILGMYMYYAYVIPQRRRRRRLLTLPLLPLLPVPTTTTTTPAAAAAATTAAFLPSFRASFLSSFLPFSLPSSFLCKERYRRNRGFLKETYEYGTKSVQDVREIVFSLGKSKERDQNQKKKKRTQKKKGPRFGLRMEHARSELFRLNKRQDSVLRNNMARHTMPARVMNPVRPIP